MRIEGRTDMTKVMPAFRDYAEVPKTYCIVMTKNSLLMICGEMMVGFGVIFRNVKQFMAK